MQQKIKLTYLPVRGRAEETRLCFYIGGIEFEDERIGYDQFNHYKKDNKLKFGQLPVLQVGNTQYAQSGAIMRFAAKKAGLYPNDPIQILLTEQALVTIQELRDKVSLTLKLEGQEKLKVRKYLGDQYYPQWLPRLENILKENGTGYFVGNSIGLADISLYNLYTWFTSGVLEGLPTNLFDNYPLLLKLIEIVRSHPKIAQWDKENYQQN